MYDEDVLAMDRVVDPHGKEEMEDFDAERII
jgi:hypothetical protein